MSGRRHELQAVVFAGGASASMSPLSGAVARHDLPVANLPLIYYPLHLLDHTGIQDVHVLCSIDHADALDAEIKKLSFSRAFHVAVHPVSSELGTAEALLLVAEHITTDFIVLPYDFVGEDALQPLIAMHGIRDASLSVLLKQDEVELDARGKPVKRPGMRPTDFFGIAEDSRLVSLASGRAVETGTASIAVTKPLLHRRPQISLRSDLRDVHAYVFARWVLDLLPAHPDLVSLQRDVVPHLLGLQFRGGAFAPDSLRGKLKPALADAHALSLTSRQSRTRVQEDCVRCHALVLDAAGPFAMRADTPAALLHMSVRLLPVLAKASGRHAASAAKGALAEDSPVPIVQFLKAKGVKEAVVADGVELGAKTTLQKCSIGHGSVIGSKVKLHTCVLMHNVTVLEGSVLQNCVVAPGVVIGARAKLIDCIIGPDTRVEEEMELKGETLGGTMEDMLA